MVKKGVVDEKRGVAWKQRLLTAGVAIPSLIGLLSLSSFWWSVFILCMTCVGYREFSVLVAYEMKSMYVLIPLVFYFDLNLVVLFAVWMFITFVPLVELGPGVGMRNGMLNLFFVNAFAVPIMFGAKMHSELAFGFRITLLWILVSFASDAGALIVGSRCGRRPLCPSISPKKTWEGVFGSLLGGVGSSVFFYIVGLGGAQMTFLDFALIGLMEAVLGITGDLIESGFKRFVSAKDASGLLPGHGGMLDRLDALAATAPFVYAYCMYRNL